MIRQIKQEQWLENIKMLYFWSKHNFPPLPHTVEGNYLEQHRETAVGNLHYITYIILHYILYIMIYYTLYNIIDNYTVYYLYNITLFILHWLQV